MRTEGIDRAEKKAYAAPQLIVHGTVAEITAGGCKTFGGSDGYFFIIPAISISNCGS